MTHLSEVFTMLSRSYLDSSIKISKKHSKKSYNHW